MKTVLFGGSFNPPHNGHRRMAENLIRSNYEQIIIVPGHTPLLKRTPEHSPSPEDRLVMVSLAMEGLPVSIDNYEIQEGRKCYAIEVVNHLYATYTITGKLGLFVGDDHIDTLPSWYKYEELLSLVDVVIAPRLGKSIPQGFPEHTLLETPVVEVSSSQIREKISQGKEIGSLVPKNVLSYIEKKSLY